ncbi:MAG TPA: hypothetical protein VFV63_05875 [Ilumatobacteraceae bacterium]|nr:hypothetical protein [Ilumatobacteraceae bacterium]
MGSPWTGKIRVVTPTRGAAKVFEPYLDPEQVATRRWAPPRSPA